MPYKDKEKQKAYVDKHYQDNRERYRSNRKYTKAKYINRNKAFIEDYLDNHPCVDCGYSNPIALDFDHVKGEKKNSISKMKLNGMSLTMISEEIAKCEVRCANCHRIVTHRRRERAKRDSNSTSVVLEATCPPKG